MPADQPVHLSDEDHAGVAHPRSVANGRRLRHRGRERAGAPEVPAHWWGPFAVWQGGLSIWGGIALGTAVGIWRLRRAGADVAAFMDVAAPGLLVAQAIGATAAALGACGEAPPHTHAAAPPHATAVP
jgi:hypothetical protein